ncbi:hypothetical protein SDC9_112819 [bioreactor metagenome]|uniref:Uncharacterized protein n=1 Tax=bioreactor metagenome TaxID=1076179 RepID=A0A645BKN3_9ZZZZ
MEIVVQGSYIRTLSFLDKLESLPRYAMITNISTQSKQNVLETKLTLVIYSFGVVQNQKPAEPAPK